MADERLLITIEGKDGVSKTFVAVGQSADAAGKSVEKAGKTGANAMKGLADETKRTAATADELERRYTAIGASIGTALGVVSKLGASFRDQRLDLQSLEAQYGSASDTIVQFTETIQDSMNQSNDAARDSALVFATLFRNYEMGEQQIIDLMGRSADIAAARGRSMTEVSQMIQNALRGEAEYIEQIGVTLNDTYVASEYAARGLGNWNTLTDEAAKAQFRYVLLMEQTADTQGRAAEEADRAGGLMRRWINEAQDAGQAVGGMLGPLGEVGAEFSQIALGLPIIAGGFGKLIGTVQNSSRAMSALSLAMNPWVLGATAAVAAGVALWNNYREGAEVIETLRDAYLDLQAASQQALISGNADTAAYLNQLRFQAESVRMEADLIHQKMQDQSQYVWNGVDYSRDDWIKLTESYEITGEEAERLAASQQKLGAALQDTRLDGAAIAAEMDNLYWQFMRGEISADEYIFRMENLANTTSQYVKSAEQATEATTGLGAAFKLVTDEADGWIQKLLQINAITEDDSFLQKFMKTLGVNATDRAAVNETLGAFTDIFTIGEDMPGPGASHQEWMDWVNEMERGTYAWHQRVKIANEAMAANAEATDDAAETTREATIAQALLAKEMENIEAHAERQAAGWDMLGQAVEDYNDLVLENMNLLFEVAGYGDPLSRWNLSGHATAASVLADNINDAATALDTVFRVAIGNTNAIAQQADSVKSWADELINVEGEYGKIDDLLERGLITQQQWTDAQQSYNSIAQDTASIQDYVLKIQAMQAPLIAEQTSALENQMEIISHLPAEQQLIALGWMDATTAARAMEFQTLAVAAANGELGANGEEAFTAMITGAVRADPVLKALLLDMNLIEEGANGEITVNFGSVEGAKSEIAMLTDSINVLIITLGGVPPNVETSINANTAEAEEAIDRTMLALMAADNESATMSLYVNDFASGVIDATNNALDALNGKIATSTIRTIYETQGLGPGKASGGVIGYAGGGVIAELAEAGSEVVHFASGGSAWVGQRGVYELSPGDYVMPHNQVSNSYGAPSITVNVNGPVFGMDDLAAQVMGELVPAIERASDSRRRQMGVA